MTRILPFFLALILVPGSSEAQEDPVGRAERLFEEGRFVEGRSLLLETLAETHDLPARQARVLEALARFSDQLAGDLDQSVAYLRRIAELPLPPEHPAVAKAREKISTQKTQDIRYKAENEILAHARSLAGRGDEIQRESCIVELRDLCGRRPDYRATGSGCWRTANRGPPPTRAREPTSPVGAPLKRFPPGTARRRPPSRWGPGRAPRSA